MRKIFFRPNIVLALLKINTDVSAINYLIINLLEVGSELKIDIYIRLKML